MTDVTITTQVHK